MPYRGHLFEGQELNAIFFNGGWTKVGMGHCTKIEVVLVVGQMSFVPWVEVTYDNGDATRMWNVACLEGVEVKE